MNNLAKVLVATVAVVAVALVGINALPGSQTGAGGPTPTAAPPTSTAAPPTPHPTIRDWAGPGRIPAGRWAVEVGSVRVAFDIPGGWEENAVPNVFWQLDSAARVGFHIVEDIVADPCDVAIRRDSPVGPTVDGMAMALVGLPHVQASGPTDASLGGYPGKLVEFDIPASSAPCGAGAPVLWLVPAVDDYTPLELNARTRVWMLDVAGARLVVFAVERASASPADRAQVAAILESITIEP